MRPETCNRCLKLETPELLRGLTIGRQHLRLCNACRMDVAAELTGMHPKLTVGRVYRTPDGELMEYREPDPTGWGRGWMFRRLLDGEYVWANVAVLDGLPTEQSTWYKPEELMPEGSELVVGYNGEWPCDDEGLHTQLVYYWPSDRVWRTADGATLDGDGPDALPPTHWTKTLEGPQI